MDSSFSMDKARIHCQTREDGFMVPPHNRKNYTRYLTDEGVEKAKELLEQIGPSLGFKKEDWGD